VNTTGDKALVERAIDAVNIEVDGIEMQVPRGSMIIEATDKAGITIPRFCYHEKLSIAANCRMCLVDVEKAPKPLPACATPVMEGMKVYTRSRRAIDAQHGVMEFLLINHPLDCPICDQGGECELQDQAMGYGRSVSRFSERKRVVKDKNVGPLIRTEMTRCIHCTRCVRFLEEVTGTSEMGGSGRGDRLEIGTCIENSIDSEMSGNVIDLCPVGALTNKPFRYSARAWELRARASVAVHDGVGSRLWYHDRRGQVLRAVPQEHEATNETWLSDRDRYSHFGLYAEDRVTKPMLRKDGGWKEAGWDEAIATAAGILRETVAASGGESIGVLMGPSAATADYFLAQRLARGLGSGNIDHRLREQDFSDDASRSLAPQFETTLAGIEAADGILLIGSNIRQEAPILGHRVRKAWLAGAQVAAINPVDWDFHFDLDQKAIVPPQAMLAELAALVVAVAAETGKALPVHLQAASSLTRDPGHQVTMAKWLLACDRAVILIGNVAMSHEQAAWLRELGSYLAASCGAGLNVLAHGGNAIGAWLAGAVPHRGAGGALVSAGLNARSMLAKPLDAYLLWDFEPELDTFNPAMTMAALEGAKQVVAVASFAGESLLAHADVILPLAPWPEAGGMHYRLDGEALFAGAAGELSGLARPGWKILRRLGAELGLDGFDQTNVEDVHSEMEAGISAGQLETSTARLAAPGSNNKDLFRVGEVSMYAIDPLCRRSQPLQQTAQAADDSVRLNAADVRRLGLDDGGKARVQQGGSSIEMIVRVSSKVPEGAAWIQGGSKIVADLGDLSGPITVEVA
jgi:NADH-quinone oxidoreductase subunit G